MHVGLVSPWESQGGLSGYTSELVQALSKNPEVEVSVIPWDPGSGALNKGLEGMQFLTKNIQKKEIDVLHVQFVMGDFLPTFLPLAGILKKLINARLVVTFHENYNYSFVPIRRTLNEYRNQIARIIDGIIIHSDTEKSWLPPRARQIASVVPHGTQSQMNTLDSESRIFLPGFISDKKDCKTAIQAMDRVTEEHPDYSLVVAGKFESEDYYLELCNMVNELNLSEKVIIRNEYIEEEEYINLFSTSEIILIPQVHSASSSGTLSEVLGYGIPAIITEAPVLKENTCYEAEYYQFGDVNGLYTSITKLIENSELREDMIKSFRDIANKNSWTNIAEHHVKIYTGS